MIPKRPNQMAIPLGGTSRELVVIWDFFTFPPWGLSEVFRGGVGESMRIPIVLH
jgi:hypothetical protein